MFASLVLLAALQLAEAGRALEQEKYADAVPLLEKALAADPADYRARFNLAFALTQLQRDRKPWSTMPRSWSSSRT